MMRKDECLFYKKVIDQKNFTDSVFIFVNILLQKLIISYEKHPYFFSLFKCTLPAHQPCISTT